MVLSCLLRLAWENNLRQKGVVMTENMDLIERSRKYAGSKLFMPDPPFETKGCLPSCVPTFCWVPNTAIAVLSSINSNHQEGEEPNSRKCLFACMVILRVADSETYCGNILGILTQRMSITKKHLLLRFKRVCVILGQAPSTFEIFHCKLVWCKIAQWMIWNVIMRETGKKQWKTLFKSLKTTLFTSHIVVTFIVALNICIVFSIYSHIISILLKISFLHDLKYIYCVYIYVSQGIKTVRYCWSLVHILVSSHHEWRHPRVHIWS